MPSGINGSTSKNIDHDLDEDFAESIFVRLRTYWANFINSTINNINKNKFYN